MKRFIFTLLVLLFSVACQEIVVVYPPIITTTGQETPDGSIQFGNYTPATKAMAGEGPNGVGYGDFNIFGFEDNTPIMDPYLVTWQQNQWVYEGIGSQQIKYFSREANQYSFIGVISNQTAVRDGVTINVPNVEAFQTTDEMNSPKEFLYTQKIVEKSNFGQYVNLTFNHLNARMFIGFASDRNDTEIIDYVHQEHYNAKNNSNVWLRAGFSTPTISDEDIAYINSWYICSEDTWPTSSTPSYTFKMKNEEIPSAYKTTVEVGGINYDFFDAQKYIASKYTITDWGNWSTPIQNGWIVLHMDKPNGYRGYFFDPWAALSTPVVQVLDGIRVFSVDDSGSPIVHKVHADTTDVNITINDVVFSNTLTNSNVIVFDNPTGNVYQSDNTSITWAQATHSPTIRYALPLSNTGYVVKFSYVYNGVTYYDARVLIPTESAAFAASKDYTYVIYITDKTNGTTDPNQAYEEKNEVDTSQKAIVFSEITFGDYTSGGHYVYTIL